MRVMVCIEMNVDVDTTKRKEIKAAVIRELVKVAKRSPGDVEATGQPDAKAFLLAACNDPDKLLVRAPEK